MQHIPDTRMNTFPKTLGGSVSRVDGVAKVTGAAKYASDHSPPDLLHGHAVGATTARGRIRSIDASEALSTPGVVAVFTHENTPGLAILDWAYRDQVAPEGHPLRLLQEDTVYFSGQPVALVVAESEELARHAAALVKAIYDEDPAATNLEEARPDARDAEDVPEPRGDAEEAIIHASVSIHHQYETPAEHHNPMEPFAATVIREADGSLTVYDKTQGVQNCHKYLTKVFGLHDKAVKVLSPFVGGAFGAGLRPRPQVFLAVLAALELERNVRVVLERKEMFTLGFRTPTIHNLRLGSSADGKLQSVTHEVLTATSRFETFSESIVDWSDNTYACENVRTSHEIAQLDVNTPCDMRAPGAAQGFFVLESGLD